MSSKAIPPARDRLQSRLLVWIGVPVLCYLVFTECQFILGFYSAMLGHLSIHGLARGYIVPSQGRYDNGLAQIVAASVIFAVAAWRLRAATPMAATCGAMICFLVSTNSVGGQATVITSGLTPLLLLFVLTFYATRLGRERKARSGLAEDRRGRNAAQVLANLGVAALLSGMMCYDIAMRFGWFGDFQGDGPIVRAYFAIPYIPMLAALAEATADTVSSEIGQAFGGTPFLLTTFRRVAPGTDGAISLLGTLAAIAAAALIAATGAPALGMSFGECRIAFAAGIAGLFFDSLLGATAERKGWVGNDLVNFTSTAFAAAVALLTIRFAQDALLR